MKILAEVGIDLWAIVAFAMALLISWAGSPLIVSLHGRLLTRLIQQDDATPPGKIKGIRETVLNDLEFNFGGLIGKMERILYIYAVITSVWTLLSAWVIMKAFFGWLDKPAQGQLDLALEAGLEGDRSRKKMLRYYVYIFGNALSLMLGIASAHLGLVLAKVIATVLVP